METYAGQPEAAPARRIGLVISTLGGGGAERMALAMAAWWRDHGREVTLVTLDRGTDEPYPFPPGVERVALDRRPPRSKREALTGTMVRVALIRRALVRRRVQAVVAFDAPTAVLCLAGARIGGPPVLAVETSSPEHFPYRPIWVRLRARMYARAAAVVVLSPASLPWTRALAGERATSIGLPLSPRPPEAGAATARRPRIVALARLERHKGQDLLVEAFARVASRHPEWTLDVYGQGPEADALRRQAARTTAADRICFRGFTRTPESELAQADVYAMASRREGLSYSLLEAMAAGLPVVATDCPTGPRDVIEDGVSGLLVPPDDVPALSAALDRLMAAPTERKRLAAGAREAVRRFAPDVVMAEWDALVAQAVARR